MFKKLVDYAFRVPTQINRADHCVAEEIEADCLESDPCFSRRCKLTLIGVGYGFNAGGV